ncbi:MAG TPA: alpha/beta fold hydrolase [Solirubrobacteraceae bacterium]|nr:alpha/beta fold hydrolase [Solirubrobacteraceae bacterium]
MPSFQHDGHRLHYETYGEGERVIVLVHGLLLSTRMQQPLAHELAGRGNRVVLLDLLGHGRSDRPRDMWRYSMTAFGRQIVGLLDHLDADQAVVGGTSLGANTALEVADLAPERLRGMVIEMPVLDNALLACAVVFSPLLVGLTFGESWMRVLSRAARAIPPRALPFWGDVLLDAVRQDPAPSAAVLQGIFFGRVAPHRDLRRTFEAPALIIGHHRDPVHPFSDSGMLADELPNGRLLEADSVVELRVSPRRLTGEIAAFVDGCWRPVRAGQERLRASR